MEEITVNGNRLSFNGKTYECAIGKSGFSTDKKEGDNCTPIGIYPLREVFYRADKIPTPKTALPLHVIKPDDGWCDAPADTAYNRQVKLPYPASHEKLWRDDDVYNLVIPLGYNDAPVIPGKGSAIFMHVARPGYIGTEGCIALKLEDLLEVLENSTPKTVIRINP